MRGFLQLITLDLKLQVRHHILTVAAIVTFLYSMILLYLPTSIPFREELLTLLLMSDPSTLGFMFVGVLVLFEKESDSLRALVVTPVKSWQYIWSKALTLTSIALLSGLIMAAVGHGEQLHIPFLFLAIAYASLIFVFVGLIGVVRVVNLNQYLVLIPFCLVPLLPPILGLFGIAPEASMWYLFPTKAILLLYQASWQSISMPDLLYALMYPLVWISALYIWVQKAFATHLSFHTA